MAKLEALPHKQEHTGLLGGVEDALLEPEPAERLDDRLRAFRTAGGGQQEPMPCWGRQAAQPL